MHFRTSCLAAAVVVLAASIMAADFHGHEVSASCGSYLTQFDSHMFKTVAALKDLRDSTQSTPVAKVVADAYVLGDEVKTIYETRFQKLKFSELK